ncbi:MAG: hypothetical protein M0002_05695 [Rhodospirillales bacterium]|nr:hypothetical protein [Rhodospirillales bacterium]
MGSCHHAPTRQGAHAFRRKQPSLARQPVHCTGWRAVNALERAFGESVIAPSAVGKEFSF